jgi:hypothetical protein
VAEGKDRTGKNPAEIAERRRRALDLRKAGATYDAIAREMGLSGSGAAFKIVKNALKATYREPAEDVRKLELERLDRLTLALWKRAQNGESEAIDRVLKLMDRRAKLLGLDAPTVSSATLTLAPFQWPDDRETAADAPSGAAGGGEPSGAVQGASLRAAMGQDAAGSGNLPGNGD